MRREEIWFLRVGVMLWLFSFLYVVIIKLKAEAPKRCHCPFEYWTSQSPERAMVTPFVQLFRIWRTRSPLWSCSIRSTHSNVFNVSMFEVCICIFWIIFIVIIVFKLRRASRLASNRVFFINSEWITLLCAKRFWPVNDKNIKSWMYGTMLHTQHRTKYVFILFCFLQVSGQCLSSDRRLPLQVYRMATDH